MRSYDPNYTTSIHFAGGRVGPEFDVEVEASATIAGGEPEITIWAVYMDMWHREGFPSRCVEDGKIDLLTSDDPLLNALGHRIANEARESEWFTDRLIEEAGIMYRGLGGNDPDGRWVYDRSAAE